MAISVLIRIMPESDITQSVSWLDRFRRSIRLITSKTRENKKFGTAFPIAIQGASTIYLTCAHVIGDIGGTDNVLLAGESASVIACGDPSGPKDLAVVAAKCQPDLSPFLLNALAERGDAIHIVGFQSFGQNYVRRDILGSLGKRIEIQERHEQTPIRAWDLLITDDDLLQHGYSGAPVIHASTKRVVAVVSHRIADGARGVALSIDVLPDIWKNIPVAVSIEINRQDMITSVASAQTASPTIGHSEQQQLSRPKPYGPDYNRIVIGVPPLELSQHFRGREVEQKALAEAINVSKIIGIVGHGGTGKTALACRTLTDLTTSTNYVATIVYLTAANIEEISLEAIVSGLGQSLEIEDRLLTIYNNNRITLSERIGLILGYLQQQTGLMVLLLDNFEKYQDEEGYIVDEDISQFLEAMAVYHSSLRILITTRVSVRLSSKATGYYQQISLDSGLPETDAVRLLRDLDPGNLGGLHTVGEETLVKLAQRAGYYPRALEAVAGILREDLMLSPIDLANTPEIIEGEIVSTLVRDAIRRLDPSTLAILQSLAVFGEPVPISALEYLVSRFCEITDLSGQVGRLVNSHFVGYDKATKLLSLHPIDRSYACSLIPTGDTAPLEFSQKSLARMAAEYYRGIRKPEDQWKNADGLRPQLREFHQLLSAEEYEKASTLLSLIDIKYLVKLGFAHEALSMRNRIPVDVLKGQVKQDHYESLGQIYKAIGYMDNSIKQYKKLATLSRTARKRMMVFNQLSNLYRRMADYEKALDYSRKALLLANDNNDQEGKSVSLMDLGTTHWCLGEYPAAYRFAQQALQIAIANNWPEKIGYIQGSLGSICLSMAQFDEAAQHLHQAMAVFSKSGNIHGQAYISERLADYYLNIEKFPEAQSQAGNAALLSKRLGDLRGEGHAYFIMSKILLSDKDILGAVENAAKAVTALKETGVPETKTAEHFLAALNSLAVGDIRGHITSLLECAKSPPNVGDLSESIQFARRAKAVAEQERILDLEQDANELLHHLDKRVKVRDD